MTVDVRLIYLLTYELSRQCHLSHEAVILWGEVSKPIPSGLGQTIIEPFEPWAVQRERQQDQALLYAHAFLVHAANASKLLWPSSSRGRGRHPYSVEDRTRRAGAMREALGIPEDSPLQSRALRDHFEHFDERLEVWYQTDAGQRLDLLDLNRIPFGLSDPNTLLSPLRMFELGRFRVMDEVFELVPIRTAVIETEEAADLWLDKNRHILNDRRLPRAIVEDGGTTADEG